MSFQAPDSSVSGRTITTAVPVAGKGNKHMAKGKGWFRRKKGSLVYTWVNDIGEERTRVVGLDTMSDAEGWTRVGELGLDQLASKSDPTKITFGALAAQYLDRYPFNKLSSRELHEQIIRRLLQLKWTWLPSRSSREN